MKKTILSDGERYIRKRLFQKRWHKVMMVLSAIVVFCTTYALILPAITMEKGCQIPEHTHSDSCYIQIVSVGNTYPSCTADTLEIHRHDESCYDAERNIVCGYADFVVHQHDSACYDENGDLWCPLTEVTEHRHEDSCYAQERGELICELHEHTDDCWTESTIRICDLEESEGHQHTADCLNEDGEIVCGVEEGEGHQHSGECYQVSRELPCGFDSDHIHSEDCYEQIDVLICDKEEVILHRHTDSCWETVESSSGEPEKILICGKIQVLQHQHSDICFTAEEVPVDTETLTCTIPEGEGAHFHSGDCYDESGSLICALEETSGHHHGQRCYGTWELTCGMDEHTHSSECQHPETEPTESAGSTEEIVYFCDKTEHFHSEFCLNENGNLTCGLEEHTHGEACTQEAQYYCGLTEHTHDSSCLDEEGNLTCGLDEHTHSKACTQEVYYHCGMTEHTHDDLCIDEEGNLICELIEHTHDALCLEVLTPEQLQAIEDAFRREVEALEVLDELTEDDRLEAEDLLTRVGEAFQIKRLSKDAYLELYDRVWSLLEPDADEDLNSIAEACVGSNWIALRDSGWFQEYSGCTARPTTYDWPGLTPSPAAATMMLDELPSKQQIDNFGGEDANEDDAVYVSKTIAGTDIENVFDITLTVQTPQVIDEVIKEPDMAVVIVMDISNTMKSDFGDGTRYEAAMLAADEFLDNFSANNSMGISKVGYVAFNTDGHKIFDLQPCTSTEQAEVLKNTMRTVTGNIINQDGYGNWNNPNKFTNMEAGLAVARDMLAGATNKNKYVIFLSDGFPTTYIKSGYTGHVPIHKVSDDTHNYIRDDLYPEKPFTYGTNYSDRGAVKAREMATSMKDSGITIFLIGVNVSGQSLEAYITQSETNSFSTMDRTSATYDIGGTGTGYFESWLRNSIGSGYYYDSTNTAGLKDAYNQIFTTIKESIETVSDADWVAKDPIPATMPDEVEFIGLYSKDDALQAASLSGTHAENAENTAAYGTDSTITWDLKTSGYTKHEEGNSTTYTYTLKYRVRLKNEDAAFVENKVYNTNGKTTLQYRVVKTVNNVISISDPKTIEFPVPSVHGYLAELTFTKQDNRGNALAGAEFTLNHDAHCRKCHGDDTAATLTSFVAVSDENGKVTFSNIPSGHTYTLTETGIPPGYSSDGTTYTVTVAYDELTVQAVNNGVDTEWNGVVVNNTYYELPETGGSGTTMYTTGGALLMAAAMYLLYIQYKRRKGEETSS